VFTARLAEKAVATEQPCIVACIADWCEDYFKYNMFEEWISASGGWVRYGNSL